MPFIQCNNSKILFLHVPRTGGTSIEAWLRTLAPLHFHTTGMPSALKCTPQHLRMSDFRALFGDNFFDHVFMIVRNPYSRIESEYRLRAALSADGFWKNRPNFSLWLEAHLDKARKNPFVLDNHLRPQWQFLGTGVEVLKYEDGIGSAAIQMAQVIGVKPPTDLPRDLATKKEQFSVEFDHSDRLSIQDFYAKDFTTFGYDPDIY